MSPQNESLSVSIVIPAKDESASLPALVSSIARQSFQPDEVIIVDGGSRDDTVRIAMRLSEEYPKLRVIETSGASPGQGRNIGIREARNEWVALTDAGIILSDDWLERLTDKVTEVSDTDIVCGNFAPVMTSLFEKVAAISYVPGQRPGEVRGKTIASYLMKRAVWEKVGGFPDMRAAEDLAFMEAAEEKGFKITFAPEAMVMWLLRPDLTSTFQKFALYSKHNVMAGRAWDWHYGIARQYLLILPLLALAAFHSPWWLVSVPLWLGARTLKRMLPHRFEHGLGIFFDPRMFAGVAALTLTIDLATFLGWIQALTTKGTRED